MTRWRCYMCVLLGAALWGTSGSAAWAADSERSATLSINGVEIAQVTPGQPIPKPTIFPMTATTCPPIATHCGAALQTVCPAIVTRCPPKETSCPAARTVCPRFQRAAHR